MAALTAYCLAREGYCTEKEEPRWGAAISPTGDNPRGLTRHSVLGKVGKGYMRTIVAIFLLV